MRDAALAQLLLTSLDRAPPLRPTRPPPRPAWSAFVGVTRIDGTAHAWASESERPPSRETCLACGRRFKRPGHRKSARRRRSGLCGACRDGYARLGASVEVVA